MNEHIFTLTLIKDDKDSRILVIHGETPAKADDEADAIVSEKNLPTTYKAIVDAIPNFKEAEDGCEDWVSHSVEEFLDIYDLDLIKVFEEAEDESLEEISDEDSTGENTPEEDVEIVVSDDELGDAEFDSDIFGSSDKDTTSPNEIFFNFKPEDLQTSGFDSIGY